MANPSVEDLLRRLAPEVLGALVRRYGNFDLAEDLKRLQTRAPARPGGGLILDAASDRLPVARRPPWCSCWSASIEPSDPRVSSCLLTVGDGQGAAQMLQALDFGPVNVACRALGILDRVSVIAAARQLAASAKVVASDLTIWAIDRAARLAASRSYAADDEPARLRRGAPQTQIGEGANDVRLFALARDVLASWDADKAPEEWRATQVGGVAL